MTYGLFQFSKRKPRHASYIEAHVRVRSGQPTDIERDTFNRAYFEGRRLSDIASADNVSLQAVKMRLHRARRRGANMPALRNQSVTVSVSSMPSFA